MEPEIYTKMLKKMSLSTASKPSRRPITAAKRKEKEKKKRGKENLKIEKPNDVGHLLVQEGLVTMCSARS